MYPLFLLHLMYPEDVGSFLECDGVEYRSSVESMVGSGGKQSVDHTLMRYAHEQRQMEHTEVLHITQQSVVVVERLTESESRIEYDVLRPLVPESLYPLSKEI